MDSTLWKAGTLPAALPVSDGRTRYVSTQGSDRGSGDSDAPWRSIQHALESAEPGEQILVRAGTYSGETGAGPDRGDGTGPSVRASPHGTPDAVITMRPYPGERAVIVGFVSLPSPKWFRLSGFVIDGAGAADGAQGVSLGNTSGSEPQHVELSYNEIRNFQSSGRTQGILHFSGSNTALVGNRIHAIGTTNLDHGLYLKGGERVVVANNVVWNITGGYGIHVWGDFDDSWVINNTVDASAASGFTLGGNGAVGQPDHVTTANNIFSGHAGEADGHQGYAAREYDPGVGDVVRRNIGWANARESPFAFEKASAADNHTVDPRFTQPSSHDYRLAGGSPAIDAAEYFGLSFDADGNPRDSRPDLGAHEAP